MMLHMMVFIPESYKGEREKKSHKIFNHMIKNGIFIGY